MSQPQTRDHASGKSIAVAIACFNQGRYLAEAIRSVLAQTRPPDEIILVDDGSTDSTRDVAAAFPSVIYVYQCNAGLSAARNTALVLTGAARILFLDADDLLRPGALAAAERCISADPARAFVHGAYVIVDDRRILLSRHQAITAASPFLELLRGNYIAMHGTVLYDAPRLRDSGGFDVGLASCEDYDVYLRLARRHPIAAYAEEAAEYRRQDQGLSTNALRMIATSRAVIHRHAGSSRQDSAHRAAARHGLDFMTRYYAAYLLDTLHRAHLARRHRDALLRLARDVRAHPAAILPTAARLLGLSVQAAVRRLRR
ncbi:MAG: glycosyltransferase family A protein [Janthinobacterium lividum]